MLILNIYSHIRVLCKRLIYKILFGRKVSFGSHVHFRRGFSLLILEQGKVEIGRYVFFNNDCSIVAREYIFIGAYTMMGENVKLYDHNHRISNPNILKRDQGFKNRPIKIGRNCWIGNNVTLLGGADIGDNSVVGAGCIVDCVIPADTIVTMNRELRMCPICWKDMGQLS
ncbi:acetyltransferase [Selenomonas sputigena ATCC 35185]|uniref:Acetyltransferase n=1 Tax=Selenomonas sputigena (strain ATCC 35185 / DSM 20758 / CCUG 44933 / VPI D19B-28) TaxID=546271 RepID=C9LV88_SELS3|nr:acetyltransferase [Selenomonas sputigena ATCC 35185]EEX77210.1 bacterial transferase hexapeptide repeat protein [Selenomonas sputigena ATCC 35185]